MVNVFRSLNRVVLNGPKCHTDSCKETKFEKTKPEPFCSEERLRIQQPFPMLVSLVAAL